MTNEEAIKEIEKWIEGCPFAYTKAAFRLAINALRKEIAKEEADEAMKEARREAMKLDENEDSLKWRFNH